MRAPLRFPRPLRPGDTVGVTAPSSGVAPPMVPRLREAVRVVRERGYEVRLGECLLTEGDPVLSAPREARAAELTAMLLDPDVAAVVPPWGGELAIDLLGVLGWEALAAAEPTWVVGFSDTSTLMLPLTVHCGWGALTGHNLMDTPYTAARGLVGWLDALEHDPRSGPLVQTSPGRWRTSGWDDYVADPGVARMSLDGEAAWSVLGGGEAAFAGRLVAGCLETVHHLAGTPVGDVPAFAAAQAAQGEGVVVLLEAAEWGALDVARALHGLRLAGWFDHARGVLVGRTAAPASGDLGQHDAVAHALGDLRDAEGRPVPVVLDVDHGHTQPCGAWVTGALVEVDTATRTWRQTW
ncbi:S66 family peptidase [Nocardioides bruguierae]|uniref:S66 family peptidase n=1 Tax=Nocardioides bruguierae TaxID=2945102 RepID=UPI002021DA40|nr:S66 peptidase family protein [Nocardioides bruguierae]MCL8026527.1 LD-carboxypeptidase [Nocardioides bruguierae]